MFSVLSELGKQFSTHGAVLPPAFTSWPLGPAPLDAEASAPNPMQGEVTVPPR